MRVLITGGCGFLGSNVASGLCKAGHQIQVFDNLSRAGSIENLSWLQSNYDVSFIHGDIRNFTDVSTAVSNFLPDAVIHLAGQVAMTISIDHPRLDFEINAHGTLNILEALRIHCPGAFIAYSSTNKVYGDLEYLEYTETESRYVTKAYPNGFNESLPLEFHSPYGCSKGAAEQYILDYGRIFGLKTVVFRHSSMYGGRQYATVDQGWVGWFCHQFVDQDCMGLSISGNGKQVRDLLHADDMISLYTRCLENPDDVTGEVFNIGGGMTNSLSLLELFDILSDFTGRKLPVQKGPIRSSDQKIFIADVKKVAKHIAWLPKVSFEDGLKDMLNWTRQVTN